MRPVIDLVDIARAREIVRQIYVDEKVKEYVLDIARETRHPPVGRAVGSALPGFFRCVTASSRHTKRKRRR